MDIKTILLPLNFSEKFCSFSSGFLYSFESFRGDLLTCLLSELLAVATWSLNKRFNSLRISVSSTTPSLRDWLVLFSIKFL